MSKDSNTPEFGYVLFKIGQIGPESIYNENLPTEITENFSTSSIELGLYLSLVISQGKGMDKEGLFGPLPWYQLPHHELFLFSFLVHDPNTQDKRKLQNTLCFLVIIFPRNLEVLINSRYGIQKSLEELLIYRIDRRIELNNESIANIMENSKTIVVNAFYSGKKIVQERTLDEIFSFESMGVFALYAFKEKSLMSCLIGEESDLPDINSLFSDKTIEEYQISVREHTDGSSSLILEFKELNTLIYIKLSESLKSHKLISLLAKIDSSLEMLSSYIL